MNLKAILEHLIECDSDPDERTGGDTAINDILLAACLDLNGDFKGLIPHHDETGVQKVQSSLRPDRA